MPTILQGVVNILEYSNQRRLQQLKAEFQEWQDQEKQKISCENPTPLPSQGLRPVLSALGRANGSLSTQRALDRVHSHSLPFYRQGNRG